jgi:hypothetical protein
MYGTVLNITFKTLGRIRVDLFWLIVAMERHKFCLIHSC